MFQFKRITKKWTSSGAINLTICKNMKRRYSTNQTKYNVHKQKWHMKLRKNVNEVDVHKSKVHDQPWKPPQKNNNK